MHLTLQINAKLGPLDRGELYEDPINEVLQDAGWGSVDGGGTMMAENGEIQFCDVEIDLTDESEGVFNQFLTLLEDTDLPKGSLLRWAEKEIPVGNLEGLALYLNGTDLPDEVYENCDINFALDELEKALGRVGSYYGSWRGPSETALYFYGPSYTHMAATMAPFLAEYPLCQKCRTVQIA